jgi:hypothetical protein
MIERDEWSTCFWNARGVCGFDISQPGRQVLCCPAGCKDFEPRIAKQDLNPDQTTRSVAGRSSYENQAMHGMEKGEIR